MKTIINCAVVGSPRCGKTSFIRRHVDGHFSSDDTIKKPIINFNTTHGKFRINIVESDFVPSNMDRIDAVIVMFDISSHESFLFAVDTIKTIREELELPIVFCATQNDKRYKPVRGLLGRFKRIGDEYECSNVTVSAKTCYNYEKPFLYIMRDVKNDDLVLEEIPLDAEQAELQREFDDFKLAESLYLGDRDFTIFAPGENDP